MKLQTKFGILAALLLLFVACKKETKIPETITTPDSYVINSANAYDWVGARHNSALDSLLKASISNAPTSRDACFQRTFDTYQSEFPTLTYTLVYERYKSMLDSLRATDNITSILTNNGVNPTVARYCQSMLDSLNAYANNNASFCAAMKTLETEIMNSSVLDSIGRAQLLSSAALMRYSSNYWTNNVEMWSGTPLSVANGGTGATAGSVAKEDGKGAVAGAVGGAFGGVAGVVGGAFLAGVGSSLASWIFD